MNVKQNNAFLPIEFKELIIGTKEEITLAHTEIIILTRGSIFLSYDHYFDREIKEGEIILLPPGCHFTVWTDAYASFCIFRIKEAIQLDPNMKEDSDIEHDMSTLCIKPQIMNNLSLLKENMLNGLTHDEYLTIKVEELIFMIRTYYSEQEQYAFFYPLLSGNARFADFVLKNYRKVKTVSEFAQLYNCSVSSFDKKFKKTFNSSVYQWMQKKKVSLLYHEISATDKPIRQIAAEQNFQSLPQFNDYCKKHFGYPPGKMRKLALIPNANKAENVKTDTSDNSKLGTSSEMDINNGE